MKKYNLRFVCMCAMVAMLSSQSFLLSMMVESGEFETEHVQPTTPNNAQPASPSHAILSEMVQKKLTNSGQQEKQFSPLTNANLAQPNAPTASQNSSLQTSSRSISLDSIHGDIVIPPVTNIDELDFSNQMRTSSQQSGSSSSASDDSLQSSPTDSTQDTNTPSFVNPNELEQVDLSPVSQQSTTPALQKNSFSTGLQLASQAASRLKSAISSSSQTSNPKPPLTEQYKLISTTTNTTGNKLLKIQLSDGTIETQEYNKENGEPVEKPVVRSAAGQAMYDAAESASNAASRLGSAMYDATGHVVQVARTIPGEIYKAPGNIAKNVFGHPDGNILTGDAYSVASAGDALYNSAEYAGAAAGRAISSAAQSARKNISFAAKKAPQEKPNPLEEHTESGAPEAPSMNDLGIQQRKDQKNANQPPSTMQNIQASLAQLDVMNWFKSHTIDPTSTNPTEKTYIKQIIDYATKNLNPVDGMQYLNDQLNALFAKRPTQITTPDAHQTNPKDTDNLESAAL